MKSIFTLLLSLAACSLMAQPIATQQTISNNMKPDVIVHTDMGDIKIRLYDETPLHKANFLKLAGEGFYNGIAFHRIIKNFMIQGGSGAEKAGGKEIDYTIPAEIVPGMIHTRGKLAAARTGDQVNPERRSSGSQFYIVTGNSVNNATLDQTQNQIANAQLQGRAAKLQGEFLQSPENAKMMEDFRASIAAKDSINGRRLKAELDTKFTEFVQSKSKSEPTFQYSEQDRKEYAEKGGSPWLDQQYTIFGEVIEGMEVVAKLEAVKTLPGDRPETAVRITSVEVVK